MIHNKPRLEFALTVEVFFCCFIWLFCPYLTNIDWHLTDINIWLTFSLLQCVCFWFLRHYKSAPAAQTKTIVPGKQTVLVTINGASSLPLTCSIQPNGELWYQAYDYILLWSFCPMLSRFWSNSKYSFVFRPIQLEPPCCVLPTLWLQVDPSDKWPAWMQILASNHQLPAPFQVCCVDIIWGDEVGEPSMIPTSISENAWA